ncbi:MAG: Lipoteichoic acid synthase 2 [Firmicutes bacterium ADurb.Bin419]|nr:MAG: Lipoteichoic acid synthase 2 [Firmicutes bacterium ADurb.Bin419]
MSTQILNKLKGACALFSEYWLLIFFIAAVTYLELIFRLWIFKDISSDFVFPLLFSLSAGTLLFIVSSLFPVNINRIVSTTLLTLLIILYSTQLIYFSVFRTPLSFFSLTGTGDVLQFKGIITTAIVKNIIAVILLFVPLVLIVFIGRKHEFARLKLIPVGLTIVFLIISQIIALLGVNSTKEASFSQYTLYYKSAIPDLSIKKLGLMTTMRLDLKRLIFGFEHTDDSQELTVNNDEDKSVSEEVYNVETTPLPTTSAKSTIPLPDPEPTVSQTPPTFGQNIIDIDFNSLIATEKDKAIVDMHKYFSSLLPTDKNKYTGIFKGSNLIMITAEGFSPYAISAELTPTLYKMSREGFVFNNFYNPIWGVSTSDGEFVACTGLIPKSGIWSFSKSGRNYMPFAMGNQFKKLGYTTKAYHNHSYKYYNRNISHPNMGYEYKGVGNGLNIKNTWPESDLEMIEVTAGEYIGLEPFHTYYMTVSGHLNYSFGGNYIARKNKAYVEDLPFSTASKAYIACNMELEFAMKALLEKLEASGLDDNTVIAISPDHYPYGLPKENIDELAGHKVEENFELYKSTFILWKKGMDPVIIDKPCSSLDIIPTLSNLFGLEYDSRLLMGSDILSDTNPLVIFSNRSWITDKARYNTSSTSVEYFSDYNTDSNYIEAINKIVSNKFKYSAKIIETDYYKRVLSDK